MTDRPNIDDLLLLWEDPWPRAKNCRRRNSAQSRLCTRNQAADSGLKAMRWMEESGEQETEPAASGIAEVPGRTTDWISGSVQAGLARCGRHTIPAWHVMSRSRCRVLTGRPQETWTPFRPSPRRWPVSAIPASFPSSTWARAMGGGSSSPSSSMTDLAEMLESRQTSPEESARLIAEVAGHLHYAASARIRPSRPQAIEYTAGPRRKTVPHGFRHRHVQARDDSSTGRPFGTLPYMAPKAVSSETNNPIPGADIYSLGVVFYELLTGRLPFDADSTGGLRNLILFQEPPPPQTIRSQIPEELQSICLKCLAKAPADRYLTAGDLSQSFRLGWQSVPDRGKGL